MSIKTKKIKIKKWDKKKMWCQFDSEILNNGDSTLECVYRGHGTSAREICDGCAGRLVITDEGFQACTNRMCGIIYTDNLDQTAEWRFYGADDSSSSDPTRCGMPINPLLKESSFGCKVLVQGSSTYEMRKIRRYTDWIGMPYKEKSQYDEFQRITILGNQSGIPKLIIDDAMKYHKSISEAKTFRGLNRDGIIAASIYVSARVNNFPRTAKEIAQIFHLDSTSATRGCKNAVSIINELENEMENTDKTSFFQTTPSCFIDRYCSRLNINTELTKVSKFVAFRIQQNNLIPENTPHSIAAGIVYFIAQTCNANISKRDVSVISEISEVTINKCYKKLVDMTDTLIPKAILEKYNIQI
jgi:transcription initiation factor TFIIB